MKKVLLGGVVLITLGLVGSALAADMPIKAPVVAANTWTGFYLGIDGGGVRGLNSTDSFTQTGDGNNPGCIFGCFDPVVFAKSPTWGGTGGVYGGYNWQFDPSWVIGVEADWSKTALSNAPGQLFLTFAGLPIPPCTPIAPGSCHGLLMGNNLSWTATARARVGYTMGSIMAYVTGGATMASQELTGQVAAANFAAFSISTSSNHVNTGWVGGGGLEFMATANWLLRIEYLHYALNSGTTVIAPCTNCGPGLSSGNGNFTWSNASLDVIRGGLSYKIGP
jgi:outer membrane immunogenic protein